MTRLIKTAYCILITFAGCKLYHSGYIKSSIFSEIYNKSQQKATDCCKMKCVKKSPFVIVAGVEKIKARNRKENKPSFRQPLSSAPNSQEPCQKNKLTKSEK